jgi:DnaJ-class molecular chaperone
MVWVVVIGFLILSVVVTVIVSRARAEEKRQQRFTRARALDHIRRMREEGTQSSICPRCRGTGRIFVWTRRGGRYDLCNHCRGLGYHYDSPVVPPSDAPTE